MVDWAIQYARQYGQPHLFFLGFEPAITARACLLQWRTGIKTGRWKGTCYTAIGARWPGIELGHYVTTYATWRRLLAPYDYYLVVAGTPLAAQPLWLMGKRYLLWVASSFEADRFERVCQKSSVRAMVHRCSLPILRMIERRIVQSATALCSTSSYTQQLFSYRNTAGHNAVIGIPVALPDALYPQSASTGLLRLIAVGRFHDPRKNLEMLLRVGDRLVSALIPIQLTIIGSLPDGCMLDGRSYIRHISTRLSYSQLQAEIAAADCMLITSHQEGLGIVGLEALAAHVPVVATDCGGVIDYVHDGKTGFIVSPDDDHAMVNAVLFLYRNKAQRKAMGLAGRVLVEKKYSFTALSEHLSAALHAVYPERAR